VPHVKIVPQIVSLVLPIDKTYHHTVLVFQDKSKLMVFVLIVTQIDVKLVQEELIIVWYVKPTDKPNHHNVHVTMDSTKPKKTNVKNVLINVLLVTENPTIVLNVKISEHQPQLVHVHKEHLKI